ncbi:hypothetical protein BC834DRAFT_974493 [Gloeopeniophorella convolvens]|nr:hypothetical protein BC834DRAFT_974493 [Gloeopeniophorella convolvens]
MDDVSGQRIALAWGIVLVLDFAVFVLTLYKALRVGWRQPMTIIYVLLRDGSLYFATMFLANLFNILTCLFAPPVLKGVSSVLTSVLCSTLVSRMMINLRQRISSERDLPTEYTGTSVVEESNEIVFDLRASYVDKRFIL